MAKKKVKLLITITFTKYVEYECESTDTDADVLFRAQWDTDLLDDALDNAEINTNIQVAK